MKHNIKAALIFCMMAFVFSSCSKTNEEGKMIPNNAMFVAQFNMKSLSEKLPWNDIKQTEWYQKAFSDSSTPEWRKKILENPEASGIDFDKSLIVFAAKGAEQNVHIVVEGTIKSEKDFEQFNKKFDPAQVPGKSGDINLLILKDKNVVGWNGKHFAYVMNSGTTSAEMYNWQDSSGLPPNMPPADKSEELSAICTKLFSLKSDSSLAKNEKFGDLLKGKDDIHIWQNTEAMMKNNSSLGMLGMLKLDVFFKDNISTYSINFDKGKIEVDQKGYAGKELTDFMKKYNGSKINIDMIKNIPSQNVFGILVFNFKPEGIKEFIKLTGADGIANMYLQQLGFNLDDVSKANNGNLLLALSDFKMTSDSFDIKDSEGNNMNKSGFKKPGMNVLFSMGVNDKASFQKIADAGKKMVAETGKDTSLSIAMNDKMFAVSNSGSFANSYLAGNKNNFDFIDKIDAHSIGGYLDLHKVLTTLAAEKTDNSWKKALLDESVNFWNNITLKGGDIKDDAITSEIEINLVDQNTNSLKQLNTYLDKMFKINESRKSQNIHAKRLDSLLTPPPIDTVKAK